MFGTNDMSMLFLLLGKENQWIPYILLLTLIIQKWSDIQNFFKGLMLTGKIRYQVAGKMFYNKMEGYAYGDLSKELCAILYKMGEIIQNNPNISKVITIPVPYFDGALEDKMITIPCTKNSFRVTDDIYCIVEYETETSTKRSNDRESDNQYISFDENKLTITFTTKKSINIIMKYIADSIVEYKSYCSQKRFNKLHILKFENSIIKGQLSVNRTEFQSSKTFDNLFFDGKEELINRLETFKARDKYKILGLPETLGLLFYGDPGTGKTSAIKAIAHYMNVNIIIVPMNIIKTKKQLEDLFFGDCMYEPQEKRMYVFEEIDCNGWSDIVRDRKYVKEQVKPQMTQEASAIEKLAESIKPDAKRQKDEDEKLTLGAILEVIDGLVECPGRIIVMTTNHKEFLDPALLRPGRIDMEVEFKKLRRTHIQQIYNKWYGHALRDNHIPDYKFTQAEIAQLLFKHENNPTAFVRELVKISA